MTEIREAMSLPFPVSPVSGMPPSQSLPVFTGFGVLCGSCLPAAAFAGSIVVLWISVIVMD
jgi:hypothetical protein